MFITCAKLFITNLNKFDMHHLGSLLWEFQGMENNLKIRECRWFTLILSVSLHNDFQHESHQLPTQQQITHDKMNNSCSDCSNTARNNALQIYRNAANGIAVLLVSSLQLLCIKKWHPMLYSFMSGCGH